MSAFTVGKDHIDLLVTVAMRIPGFDPKFINIPLTGTRLGQTLWTENYASVNYRYAEDTPVPEYIWESVPEVAEGQELHVGHLLQILKAANVYEYQSMEHPGWSDSASFWVTHSIISWCGAELDKAGVRKIRTRSEDPPTYEGYRLMGGEWDRSKGFLPVGVFEF
jgi:hypothetical protein